MAETLRDAYEKLLEDYEAVKAHNVQLMGRAAANSGVVVADDGTALALFIEIGAYLDPKLTEHDKAIVLSKIKRRLPAVGK